MRTINRVFAVVLALIACTWVWNAIVAHRDAAAADTYYKREVQADMDVFKSQVSEYNKAQKEGSGGKLKPFPDIKTPDFKKTDEWMVLVRIRNQSNWDRERSTLAFMITLVVWIFFALFQGLVAKAKWGSSDRSPDPQAGKLVAKLESSGEFFSAMDGDGVDAKRVDIDGRRRVAIFHNLSFVSKFVGNPVKSRIEVSFDDMIVGTMNYSKGGSYFVLRTTKGKVTFGEQLQPYEKLVQLLQDAAEENRKSPQKFQSALAREPVVKTPWYGWAIIALAVGAVGAVFWQVMIRG